MLRSRSLSAASICAKAATLLSTPQATGMGFGSTAALATTLTLNAAVNCVGIGFQRGTHARWQIVHNDASGTPTLIDASAAFALVSER